VTWTTNAGTPQFVLVGPEGTPAVADVLDIWTGRLVPTPGGDLSFDSGEERGPVQAVSWNVTLPSDEAAALGAIVGAHARLARGLGALSALDQEPSGHGALLGKVEGLMSEGREHWQLFQQQCAEFLQGVAATFGNSGVQTHLGAIRIGWSSIPMLGQIATVLPAGLDRQRITLHMCAVDLAVRSRVALLRILALIARYAGLAAALMNTTVNPLSGVLAAWRLVHGTWRGAR
jgi:hypothetical protein